MFSPVKALIFDMDGVLIDSEPLWRRAMVAGFNEFGIGFTEEDCRKTTGMRFTEVVQLWLRFHQKDLSHVMIENKVLQSLIHFINTEGVPMRGAMEIFRLAKAKNLKVGLATSSPQVLLDCVLKKLELEIGFDAIVSAEKMPYGKPHPEVFLECAKRLQVAASDCVVIEDSVNGVIAAKAAQMRVYAVPDAEHKNLKQFGAADWHCEDMTQVLQHFRDLL
jgi:mannitol-1-/sugar-/sorbitol-6-/2-deoxyglucose-6-phosphatase